MGWLSDRLSWFHAPWTRYSDIDARLIRISAGVEQVPLLLNSMEARMSAREDASRDALVAKIADVKQAWATLTKERDDYKAALEQADADKAAAVQAALDEDSNHDADWADAQIASLDEVVPGAAPAEPESPAEPEVPAEPAPVEDPAVDEGDEQPPAA